MRVTPFDLLQASLLDLLYELRKIDLQLILGGGYGLYLKERHIRETGSATLLEPYPEARSTNDLDLFLRTELVADPDRFEAVSDALRRLGCEPIPEAKYLQFVRSLPAAEHVGQVGQVKFDFLTGPRNPAVDARLIAADSRRARPRGRKIPLHAHPTPEAVGIEEQPLELTIKGARTGGEQYAASIFLPQPFSYAMMKLFAFRDRQADPAKDYARHHALDLYSILAMATEREWDAALGVRARHAGDAKVQEAGHIVREHFGGLTSPGMLRLREHPLCSPDLDLPGFLSVLGELFRDLPAPDGCATMAGTESLPGARGNADDNHFDT